MSKWKSSVISLGIALFFAIACYFMPSKVNLFWSLVVAAITFLISFVFVELEGYLERMHGIETNNNYRFYEECGISEYHKDFSEIDFSSCITKATHIKIVLLYSNRFISTYINSLRNFVAREGTTLEVILLSDNKEKHSYRYISDKLGYGENGLAKKLAEFYQLISNDILLSKNAKSSFSVTS